MPLVGRDVLQGLAHAPLVGGWADSVLTVGQFAFVDPTGAVYVACATYTVPSNKIACITGVSICLERATVFGNIRVTAAVNGVLFLVHFPGTSNEFNMCTSFHRVLKPGNVLLLQWMNNEAAIKRMGILLTVEEIDIGI